MMLTTLTVVFFTHISKSMRTVHMCQRTSRAVLESGQGTGLDWIGPYTWTPGRPVGWLEGLFWEVKADKL